MPHNDSNSASSDGSRPNDTATTAGARKPLAPFAADAAPRNYYYSGRFDRNRFYQEFKKSFASVAKANVTSLGDLDVFLRFLEDDVRIADLRFMAYLLATAFVETSKTTKVMRADGRGTKKIWTNYKTDAETGRGQTLRYGPAVKVLRHPNGHALVTEQDGDQYAVNIDGTYSQTLSNGDPKRPGAPVGGPVHPAYVTAPGVTLEYYGRGYNQLTWWFNYASAGRALRHGLKYLFEPDLVMVPKTSYDIMSGGMLTGSGFANGHRLSDYISGGYTNYKKAREIINAKDPINEVYPIALLFDQVLLASQPEWKRGPLRVRDQDPKVPGTRA